MTVKKKFVLETLYDVLREEMKDPEFKKAWEELDAEFQVERALIELRVNSKKTQRELAEDLDTKQAYISRVEHGKVSPTVNYVARMAEALDADAEIVFRPRGSKKVIKAILVKEKKAKYSANPETGKKR